MIWYFLFLIYLFYITLPSFFVSFFLFPFYIFCIWKKLRFCIGFKIISSFPKKKTKRKGKKKNMKKVVKGWIYQFISLILIFYYWPLVLTRKKNKGDTLIQIIKGLYISFLTIRNLYGKTSNHRRAKAIYPF